MSARRALAAPSYPSVPKKWAVTPQCPSSLRMTHHDIEAAEGLDGLVDEGLDVLLLGDVALDGNGLRGGEAGLNLLGGLLDGLGVDVRHDDLGALSGELERGLETDAADCQLMVRCTQSWGWMDAASLGQTEPSESSPYRAEHSSTSRLLSSLTATSSPSSRKSSDP